MKKERLQETMQKYKVSYENIMSNYMLIKMVSLEEMDRFLVQPPKIEPGRNRNYELPNHKH